MKGVYFTLIAFLTFTALAAALYYDRRDIELPPGAFWRGSTAVLANDITDDFPDSGGEHDEPDTSDQAEREQTTEFSSMAATTLDKRAWPSNRFAVDVRTGGPKQHVGTLRKQRLYNAVYNCLQLIGHQGHGEYKGDTGREQEIGHQDMWAYCQLHCEVPNIVYNAGKGKYATNAHLDIWVGWSELKEHQYAGIREVAYKFAANIYKMQLEESENCYYTDFENSRKTLMCNVPRNLLMVWPTRLDEEVAARLNLNVEFNGKTTDGRIVCENNLDKIKYHFGSVVRKDLAKVMNWPQQNIVLFNTCQKDACFDIGKDYFPGMKWDTPSKKWIEPKACNPSDLYTQWH